MHYEQLVWARDIGTEFLNQHRRHWCRAWLLGFGSELHEEQKEATLDVMSLDVARRSPDHGMMAHDGVVFTGNWP